MCVCVCVCVGHMFWYELLCTDVQAHIHKGVAGANGEAIAWLHPLNQTTAANPPAGTVTNGILVQVVPSGLVSS